MIKSKITAFFAAICLCVSFASYAVIDAIPLFITVDSTESLSGSLTCPTCSTVTSFSETVTGNVDAVFNISLNSNGSSVQKDTMADGSTMILPMFGQSSVTITAITGNGTIVADDNPVLEANGIGTGVNNYLFYDSTKNIVNSLPITYTQDTTLFLAKMKTITGSDDCDTQDIEGECVEAYLKVSILFSNPSAGAANTFRPSITATTKELITWDDIDLTKMKCVSNADFVAPTTSEYEAIAKRYRHNSQILRLWYNGENYSSEGGRAYGAHIIQSSYASVLATTWLDDMAQLQSCGATRTDAGWKKAFASMHSYSMDIYHVKYSHASPSLVHFGTGAGQWTASFPLALWAVNMLDSDSKFNTHRANISSASTEYTEGTRILPQLVGNLHTGASGVFWGDPREATPPIRTLWADYFNSWCWPGSPNPCAPTGSKSQNDIANGAPQVDGPVSKPGSSYFSITTPIKQAYTALMCNTVGLAELLNNDKLVTYSDRITASGIQVAPDVCAPVDPLEDVANCDVFKFNADAGPSTLASCQSVTGCTKYCETWGPDPTQPTQCIQNNTGGNTGQTGRYSNLSTTYVPNATYTSYPWVDNYSALRGSAVGCKGITSS